ncbi:MAG: flagellar basal body-associated FliL family protein [Verrucomicrobiae bacterium]|nr:flagellar basal body-associated FliL family protein [Verrucomicrobiae bacterium]
MATEPDVEPKQSKGGKRGLPLVPLLIVVLVVPVVTLALTEFVIIPRLQSSLGSGDSASHGKSEQGSSGGGHSSSGGGGHGSSHDGGDHGDLGPQNTYEFKDVICNLSGTMGTRFLKVSFEVAGSDPDLSSMIRMKRPRVKDAIITTLSSRTIQDLEVPGGRNALRVALITAINQAIGFEAVEELFFTDFIVQ